MFLYASSTITPNYPAHSADYHVVPYADHWAVKCERYDDYSGEFTTKHEAIDFAVGQARRGHQSVVLHGMNGKIQQVWNYA